MSCCGKTSLDEENGSGSATPVSGRPPRKAYKWINEPPQRNLSDIELLSLPADHIDIYFPPTVYVSGSIAARRTQHAIGRLSETLGTFVWMSAGFESAARNRWDGYIGLVFSQTLVWSAICWEDAAFRLSGKS